MRILITGGAGFIGSHLIEHHLRKGDFIHVIDNLSTGSLKNIKSFQGNPHFKFSEDDILLCPELVEIVSSVDRIYHLAAVVGVFRVLAKPVNVLATNSAGCERLLRAVIASKKKPRIIIASSSEVYGPSTKSILDENDNLIIDSSSKIRWNYAISKLSDEAFGLAYFQNYELPVTIVRIFNTIGPRQVGMYGMVVPRFIEQAVKNEPIVVFGEGEQTRSFCDVRDMVVMLDLLASCNDSIGEIVNVGNDEEISINELAKIAKKITKSKSMIKHISYYEAYGMEYFDIKCRRPKLSKLNKLINYMPKWCLESSVEDIFNSIRVG